MTGGSSQGLFVIVAVVIFGIFVLISYMLFGDKMKTSLASIFDTSIEQSLDNLTGNTGVKLKNQEEDSNYIYSKIREGKNGESDVWVQLIKLDNDELAIMSSSSSRETLTYNSKGSSDIQGDLIIPSFINGKKITEIKDYAFSSSKFSGTFSSPSVKKFGYNVFLNSVFTGYFDAPNAEVINSSTFQNSIFTGTLNLPNVKIIETTAFRSSKFTGELSLPNVTSIENSSFRESKFTGNLNIPNIVTLGKFTFYNSIFTGNLNTPNLVSVDNYSLYSSKLNQVNAPNLSKLGVEAIKMNTNKYYKLP